MPHRVPSSCKISPALRDSVVSLDHLIRRQQEPAERLPLIPAQLFVAPAGHQIIPIPVRIPDGQIPIAADLNCPYNLRSVSAARPRCAVHDPLRCTGYGLPRYAPERPNVPRAARSQCRQHIIPFRQVFDLGDVRRLNRQPLTAPHKLGRPPAILRVRPDGLSRQSGINLQGWNALAQHPHPRMNRRATVAADIARLHDVFRSIVCVHLRQPRHALPSAAIPRPAFLTVCRCVPLAV